MFLMRGQFRPFAAAVKMSTFSFGAFAAHLRTQL
jgi:hypothetical protein